MFGRVNNIAEAVMMSAAPTLTVATANAPAPLVPGRSTIPLPLGVAASAMMSGTGVVEAESNSVLSPEIIGAGSVLLQSNCSSTSVGANGPVGVNTNRKVCNWPPGMSTGGRD